MSWDGREAEGHSANECACVEIPHHPESQQAIAAGPVPFMTTARMYATVFSNPH